MCVVTSGVMGLSTGGGGGVGEGETAIWFIASSFLQSKTQNNISSCSLAELVAGTLQSDLTRHFLQV